MGGGSYEGPRFVGREDVLHVPRRKEARFWERIKYQVSYYGCGLDMVLAEEAV